MSTKINLPLIKNCNQTALKHALINSFLIFISVSLTLLGTELAWRIFKKYPVFSLQYLPEKASFSQRMGTVVYDSNLGWVMSDSLIYNAPNNKITTTKHGIRKNSDNTEVLVGSILAVGDSFTHGSEVNDNQSWPAILERKLGETVLNAGVGGYGVDQIYLRAEKLVELLNPKILIFGILDQDILRNQYSSFGAQKPVFTLNNSNELELKNHPVPKISDDKKYFFNPLFFLGYSNFFIDNFSSSFPKVNQLLTKQEFKEEYKNGVGVTCELLKKISEKLKRDNIPLIVVFQYGGGFFASKSPRPDMDQAVIACIDKLSIPLVDEFEALSLAEKRGELEQYYVMHSNPKAFGHMSEKGNALIANLIKNKIDELKLLK